MVVFGLNESDIPLSPHNSCTTSISSIHGCAPNLNFSHLKKFSCDRCAWAIINSHRRQFSRANRDERKPLSAISSRSSLKKKTKIEHDKDLEANRGFCALSRSRLRSNMLLSLLFFTVCIIIDVKWRTHGGGGRLCFCQHHNCIFRQNQADAPQRDDTFPFSLATV